MLILLDLFNQVPFRAQLHLQVIKEKNVKICVDVFGRKLINALDTKSFSSRKNLESDSSRISRVHQRLLRAPGDKCILRGVRFFSPFSAAVA